MLWVRAIRRRLCGPSRARPPAKLLRKVSAQAPQQHHYQERVVAEKSPLKVKSATTTMSTPGAPGDAHVEAADVAPRCRQGGGSPSNSNRAPAERRSTAEAADGFYSDDEIEKVEQRERSCTTLLKEAPASFPLRKRLEKLAACLLLTFVAVTQQGCLPPDWSWCQCDFMLGRVVRDNYWNHVINDWVTLYSDMDKFSANIRDPESAEHKYFQEMPEGFNCPKEQPTVFWKAWPQLGMTRGLIENTAGDLWMPAARARITGTCMAGHMALLLLCSQAVLFEAHKLEGGDQMRKLELFFGYMVILRDLGESKEFRQCMNMEGFPFKSLLLRDYAIKWIGNEAGGVQPQAAYYGGRIDIFQMLYSTKAETLDRKAMLPGRRPCVPYKEPQCWKRKSLLLMETCEYCCSNFQHKGGRGAPWCFTDYWTFEKCCQTDMIDLECEEERTGEDGGCVDCKKQIIFRCFTPPEMQLYKAQVKYNKGLAKDADLRKTLEEQLAAQTAQHGTMMERENEYQQKLQVSQLKLNTFAAVVRNVTRQGAEIEQENQWGVYNKSFEEHNETYYEALRTHAILTEALRSLNSARDEVAHAATRISANETERDRLNNSVLSTTADCENRVSQMLQRHSEEEQAKHELAAATGFEKTNQTESRTRNATLAEGETTHRDVFVPVNETKNEAERVLATATEDRTKAEDAFQAASRDFNEKEGKRLGVERDLHGKNGTRLNLLATIAEEEKALAGKQERWKELSENATKVEARITETEADMVKRCTNSGGESSNAKPISEEQARCLLNHRPGIKKKKRVLEELRKKQERQDALANGVPQIEKCDPQPPPPACENSHEHCDYWSKNGYCQSREKYMRKTCAKACDFCPEAPPPKCYMVPDENALVENDAGAAAAALSSTEAADTTSTTQAEQEEDDAAPEVSEEELSTAELRAAKEVLHAKEDRRRELQGTVQEDEESVKIEEKAQGLVINRRQAAAQKTAEARRVADEKSQLYAVANATLEEKSGERDEAQRNVTLAESWVVGNETRVADAEGNVTAKQSEQSKAVKMMQDAKENEEKTQELLRQRGLEKKKLESQLEAVEARLEYYSREIATMNATTSSDVKNAIGEWFGKGEKTSQTGGGGSRSSSSLLTTIGDYLSSAVDLFSHFVSSLGLTSDEATHMKELVRLMEQETTAKSDLGSLQAERARVSDTKASEQFLERVRQEKIDITVFLKKCIADVGSAKEFLQTCEAELEHTKAVVLVEAKSVLSAAEGVVAEAVANQTSARTAFEEASGELEAREREEEAAKTEEQAGQKKIDEKRELLSASQKVENEFVAAELRPAEERVREELKIAFTKLGDKRDRERKEKLAVETCGIQPDAQLLEAAASGAAGAAVGASEGAGGEQLLETSSLLLALPDPVLTYFSYEEALLRQLDRDLQYAVGNRTATDFSVKKQSLSIAKNRQETARLLEAMQAVQQQLDAETAIAESAKSAKLEKDKILTEKITVHEEKQKLLEKAIENWKVVGKDVLTLQAEAEAARANWFAAIEQLSQKQNLFDHAVLQREGAVNASQLCNDTKISYAQQLEDSLARVAQAYVEEKEVVAEALVDDKHQFYNESSIIYEEKRQIEEDYRRKMNLEKTVLERRQRRVAQIDIELEYARKIAEKQQSKQEMLAAEAAVMAAQKLFDETTKGRQTTEEGIYNNTQEVYAVMEEIKEAQKVHDAQDPKDRERSFAVAW